MFIAHLICRFISSSPNVISSLPNPGAQPTVNILPNFKSGNLIHDIESLSPIFSNLKHHHDRELIHFPTIPIISQNIASRNQVS